MTAPPAGPGPDSPDEPAWPADDTEPATLAHLAALEQRVRRWLRSLETEQFQVSGEVVLMRNAVEMANNGLDNLEDGLADMSYQFSNLYAQMQAVASAPPVGPAAAAEDGPAAPAPETSGGGKDGAGSAAPVARPSPGALHAWVTVHIAPMVRKTTTTGEGGGIRWCRQWWLHHDAVERFTALYLAFGELSDSDEPSWLSVYLRDHLDPHLATLTSPYGPFHACTPNRHSATVAELGHDPAPQPGADPATGRTA
ncbi:DUF4913 domain-containing protein [Amycolatopsis rubida]|uniref:DUF4913 domain-containing protein n=1 Tax=Amycolatopsis rubida TaxID=112413 RepID=A0A1I5XG79_9PSEU|nr:DUF4913 domain-containing protein [Amycolatopsis rubida]SFQ30982.1 protein of unknown function [Amycolatopsis rubida]